MIKRNRIYYGIGVLLVMGAGLFSRRFSQLFPAFVNQYLGDSLWALMIFLIGCVFFPKQRRLVLFIGALLFCWLIEISQLYQADWINAIRATTLGSLVLGHGFLWSDMLAYTLGVGAGTLIDGQLGKRK